MGSWVLAATELRSPQTDNRSRLEAAAATQQQQSWQLAGEVSSLSRGKGIFMVLPCSMMAL